MNNDTPITNRQAGWAVAGQYGISRGKELMPDKDGPFVHACIARELERENARLRDALGVIARGECCFSQRAASPEMAAYAKWALNPDA